MAHSTHPLLRRSMVAFCLWAFRPMAKSWPRIREPIPGSFRVEIYFENRGIESSNSNFCGPGALAAPLNCAALPGFTTALPAGPAFENTGNESSMSSFCGPPAGRPAGVWASLLSFPCVGPPGRPEGPGRALGAALGCAGLIGPVGADVDESGRVFFCTLLNFIISPRGRLRR